MANIRPSIDASVTVAAFDMRGHGDTVRSDAEWGPDLSLAKLVEDAVVVTNTTIDSLETDSSPLKVILVGHSLGGAVVVRAAAAGRIKSEVVGVVVVDIVEGSALASLPHLPTLLASRPDTFESVEEGIKWSLEARMVNNPSSALHSVPPMLKETDDKTYAWRTNLHETAAWWHEWYKNLSKDFLALPKRTSKLLILASTDSLDKELMIGQMQGKFQFQVVDSAGHSVHEDQPEMFSSLLWTFLLRITGGADDQIRIRQSVSSSKFETVAKK
jgi:protein phosphatase methylesterase 1